MTRYFSRASAFVMAAALCGPLATETSAATFNVSPTQIFLDGRTSSALLTLRNEADEPIRFQLSAFAWDQSAAGEMKLSPTEDVVFFPALLTLGPKEERKIRIGRVVGPAAVERTYRIFVEEMPSVETAASGTGVKVLTKMGIPIFVRPAKESTAVAISGLDGGEGAVRFSLANQGTVHVVPERVVVRGLAGSEAVFEGELQAWYLLAGGTREFAFPLPKDCSRATTLHVEVSYGDTKVDQRGAMPAGACIR